MAVRKATKRRASKRSASGQTATKRGASKRAASKRRPAKRAARGGTRWSAKVMRESDALDLDQGVFKLRSARAIAASLKRSADASKRRKSTPYRSAMSMLNFYINRGGKTLAPSRLRTLEAAKQELRRAYGRA